MTEEALLFGGFINSHCQFYLNDGTELQGVIVTSPDKGHGHYCFVPTNKMKEYQALDREGKKEAMRPLAQDIDFSSINRCKKL